MSDDATARVLELKNRFRYHAPKDETTKQNHEFIREMCLELAKSISAVVPNGREQALALTKIEEVMFWANAGIARNPS